MLVRKQILIEEQQALDLEEIAIFYGSSMSKKAREMFEKGIRVEKINMKKIKKSKNQYDVWDKWIAGAVKGPGDSEYDKYAYGI